MADRPVITKAHRTLIGAVAVGAFIIAGIGFAGSYAAVRELATRKGFGIFAYVFPVGVDVGIAVLLALDLVLTWLRIPFPLLRQAAWLLTAGTIVFNAASSFGDPLAMGMHAIIPLLFIVVVEAARHAVGRIADITADRYMESVRLLRWILSPLPTFRLWRRMKLWELRSYDEVIRLEQNRLVYRTYLRAQHGRGWRYRAPVELLLPLKLARYGVPLNLDLVRQQPLAFEVGRALETPAAHTVPHPQPAQQQGPHGRPQAPQGFPQQQPGHPAQHPAQPATYAPQQPGYPQPGYPQPGQPAEGAFAPPAYMQAPQPAPTQPLTGPAPDPHRVAVDVLANIARNRHRRPLSDPDGTPVPEQVPGEEGTDSVADQSTRGIGWLPNQQQPQPNPGHQAWFGGEAQAGHEQMPGEQDDVWFEALSSYLQNFDHEPDPQKLSEYLAAEYNVNVAPSLLDKHWSELSRRYAERTEATP